MSRPQASPSPSACSRGASRCAAHETLQAAYRDSRALHSKKRQKHDPSCRPALAGIGRIAFDAGRFREAAEHLDHALRIEPRDAKVREMLGKAHEKLGRHRSGARHLRRAEDSR